MPQASVSPTKLRRLVRNRDFKFYKSIALVYKCWQFPFSKQQFLLLILTQQDLLWHYVLFQGVLLQTACLIKILVCMLAGKSLPTPEKELNVSTKIVKERGSKTPRLSIVCSMLRARNPVVRCPFWVCGDENRNGAQWSNTRTMSTLSVTPCSNLSGTASRRLLPV